MNEVYVCHPKMIKKGVVAGVIATTIVGAGVGGVITYSKLNKDEF